MIHIGKKYELIVIGSIGYDVYITGGNNKIILTPGGFAWHCAMGVHSINKKATIYANITQSFNLKIIEKVKEDKKIKWVLNKSSSIFENLYIFDLNNQNYTSGLYYSEGTPSNVFNHFSHLTFKRRSITHIGTTNPATMVQRVKAIQKVSMGKSIISTNIYLPYLNRENLKWVRVLIDCSSILFMNYEEFLELKSYNLLADLKTDKLVVVTCGKKGVVAFINGFMQSSVKSYKKKELSAIGAGDVFIGAFLGAFADGVDIKTAMNDASTIASQSVTQYGSLHLKKKFIPFRTIKGGKGSLRLCSIEDFRLTEF